jgi:hypothetical protein
LVVERGGGWRVMARWAHQQGLAAECAGRHELRHLMSRSCRSRERLLWWPAVWRRAAAAELQQVRCLATPLLACTSSVVGLQQGGGRCWAPRVGGIFAGSRVARPLRLYCGNTGSPCTPCTPCIS